MKKANSFLILLLTALLFSVAQSKFSPILEQMRNSNAWKQMLLEAKSQVNDMTEHSLLENMVLTDSCAITMRYWMDNCAFIDDKDNIFHQNPSVIFKKALQSTRPTSGTRIGEILAQIESKSKLPSRKK